ncbi:glycosyltransferase [Atopobacter sp. AH10]|uniref:glycosyltransferase n=1 Tax=Atopobacter sp. AH10 TaxID=2315861 RepID=UPI000EF26EFC|nr:glycosyltransferase [Atopobacter sp. AH10]RLK63644.1 glycosyltransferase [Atopobacter sp. AH10]
METSKTVVVLVTYQPKEKTVQLLESFIHEGQAFLLVDNGSKASAITAKLQELCQEGKRKLDLLASDWISLEENKGLAAAQNVGIRKAKELGAEGIFFFDQDSAIPDHFFKDMVLEYNRLLKNYPIGILAPNLYDSNLHQYGRYARLTPHGYETLHDIKQAESVSFVVSSASFMPIEVFEGDDLFREEFFIDQVDTEWSLRLLSRSYAIVVTNRVTFSHTIGDRTEHHFLGLTIRPNHHGALRKFYIFRNGRKTIEIYGKTFPGFKRLMTFRLIHDVLGVILYEKDKEKKISAMWKGWKMGKQALEEWKAYED